MRSFFAPVAALILMAGIAAAQDRDTAKTENGQERPAAMSPEMYAYLQELRQYDNPKQNAKRAAMLKAEQRRARLAAQQWYGYSNLRPMVNPIPFMGTYSPMWAGNGPNEFYWYGGSNLRNWNYVEHQVTYGQ